MRKRKGVRFRYILLIILALLPIYKFYHPNDYCFGDKDLVILGFYIASFFIPFVTIVFFNLYMISLKKELFNYRPILIFIIYIIGLSLALTFHNKNIFKTEAFKILQSKKNYNLKVNFFKDSTFVYGKITDKLSCYYKGNYTIKKDSVFLNFNDTILQNLNKKFYLKSKHILLRP